MEIPCGLLDKMIEDERKAPLEYARLKNSFSEDYIHTPFIKILMNEHSDDENKHYEALKKLKEVVC